MGERLEILMRIVVAIVTGIILSVWKWFIFLLGVINWIFTLFAGRRLKDLANLCEVWNTQFYVFLRYITLVTNERPFPFRSLTKNISNFSKK